jgi:putative endonuclease
VVRVKDAVGRYGEEVAAQYLSEAGLRILARNWRCPAGEIDIVGEDGALVVICEVKTRSSLRFGDPAEAVDRAKAARLRRLGETWLAAHGGGREARYDVVTVLRRPGIGPLVRHLRGAL